MRGQLEDFNGENAYHVKSRMVCSHESQGHVMAIEDLHYVLHIMDIVKDEYGPAEGLRGSTFQCCLHLGMLPVRLHRQGGTVSPIHLLRLCAATGNSRQG